ncbi:hypothetical protein SeLEV6574_g02904 [Synchytrium endobioticum]|nr:hypothetical protein SeLEV6574_g02904 [Synchytrium endobioticum]
MKDTKGLSKSDPETSTNNGPATMDTLAARASHVSRASVTSNCAPPSRRTSVTDHEDVRADPSKAPSRGLIPSLSPFRSRAKSSDKAFDPDTDNADDADTPLAPPPLGIRTYWGRRSRSNSNSGDPARASAPSEASTLERRVARMAPLPDKIGSPSPSMHLTPNTGSTPDGLLSLGVLLKDGYPHLPLKAFRYFLETVEFSVENLDFWECVTAFREYADAASSIMVGPGADQELESRALQILQRFMVREAPQEINIPISMVSKVVVDIMERKLVDKCSFDGPADHVYHIMRTSSFPHFIRLLQEESRQIHKEQSSSSPNSVSA